MRKLLLALPLASLLLLAGCACNTCPIPADECTTCVAPAQGWEYVTASATKSEPAVEVATVKPQFKAIPVEVSSSPLIADAEEKVETPAPVKTVAVAPKAEKKTVVDSSMPRIPTMPLPEGWNYVDEKDLSGGAINTVAVDQYYTQATTSSSKKVEDI